MIFCLILTRLIFSSTPFFVPKKVVIQINNSNEQHYVVSNAECNFFISNNEWAIQVWHCSLTMRHRNCFRVKIKDRTWLVPCDQNFILLQEHFWCLIINEREWTLIPHSPFEMKNCIQHAKYHKVDVYVCMLNNHVRRDKDRSRLRKHTCENMTRILRNIHYT